MNHLDDAVLLRERIERVLDVALAHDAQTADDFDGGGAQLEVLAVGEGLRRRHHDRVARVHPWPQRNRTDASNNDREESKGRTCRE